MNPFCFKVTMPKEERLRRKITYIAAYILLIAAFLWGFVTVYVNCYNSMHAEPMTVCRFYVSEESINVILLGREFVILHTGV